eukprot:CAMPEP_0182551734 /NCGR_PEP_ID=MMETSP1323-20130603/46018_1 /TAXON_ID=236787 /ORGANISM="Florenciella parvula, Strain RCC1693" /LENGTH=39 /DNA_ID= /DNA_START= /DNA_END= /DNA_ORIENTATION=
MAAQRTELAEHDATIVNLKAEKEDVLATLERQLAEMAAE